LIKFVNIFSYENFTSLCFINHTTTLTFFIKLSDISKPCYLVFRCCACRFFSEGEKLTLDAQWGFIGLISHPFLEYGLEPSLSDLCTKLLHCFLHTPVCKKPERWTQLKPLGRGNGGHGSTGETHLVSLVLTMVFTSSWQSLLITYGAYYLVPPCGAMCGAFRMPAKKKNENKNNIR
jgi:hypothetical protein